MKLQGFILFAMPLCLFSQQAPGPANHYVGSAVCKTCHPDVWLNFNRNPHFKSIASGKEPAEKTGCEGCHGPGGNHVEARGGKSSIRAFSLFTPDQALNACLTCHSKDLSRANIRRSAHTQADVVCTNCHSIHKARHSQISAGQTANGTLLHVPRARPRAV